MKLETSLLMLLSIIPLLSDTNKIVLNSNRKIRQRMKIWRNPKQLKERRVKVSTQYQPNLSKSLMKRNVIPHHYFEEDVDQYDPILCYVCNYTFGDGFSEGCLSPERTLDHFVVSCGGFCMKTVLNSLFQQHTMLRMRRMCAKTQDDCTKAVAPDTQVYCCDEELCNSAVKANRLAAMITTVTSLVTWHLSTAPSSIASMIIADLEYPIML